MLIRARVPASRMSFGAALRISSVVAASALLATSAAAGATVPAHRASALPCSASGKGAPWSYKGQKGTTYSILGVNGASCSLGAKWLKRITTSHGSKSPAGWMCLAISGVGECQVKGGGIFEFTPKLKK
jgi:hypothetical protein